MYLAQCEQVCIIDKGWVSCLGPPCSTIVTGPTRWVTPPTLTAAVSNSLIWINACLRVLPRLQRVCAADKKLLLDTYVKCDMFHVKPDLTTLGLPDWGNVRKTAYRQRTAWSGVVPMKAKSCPSSTLYVGLSRLSSTAKDCSKVNELLRWLDGWCRLLKISTKQEICSTSCYLFI